jgi:hypothetical protein
MGTFYQDLKDSNEILVKYLRIYRKSTEKIQVSLKYNKNNGYFLSGLEGF